MKIKIFEDFKLISDYQYEWDQIVKSSQYLTPISSGSWFISLVNRKKLPNTPTIPKNMNTNKSPNP